MLKLRFTTLFKVIMLAMLTVGVTSSCSRDNHKVKHYDAIQLGTSAVGTKALVGSKASLVSLSYGDGTNITGFGVYGYKSILSRNNYTYRQFNNTLVYPESGDENTTWTYTPTRYWDSDTEASYQFGAYWPHLTDDETEANGGPYVSETGKVLTIHDIPYWQPASTGTDLLIDAKSGKYNSYPQDSKDFILNGGTVNFNFEHALSRVQVRAYYSGAQAQVAVNQITLESPDNSTPAVLNADGKAVLTRDFSQNQTTNQYGTIQSGASKDLMTKADTLPADTWYDETLNTDPEKFDTLCSWFTVPCSLWQDLKLSVNYSISGSALSGSASGLTLRSPIRTQDNQPDTLNGQTLPGYSYMITLKFTASSGMEIDSIFVQDWIPGADYSPNVYNW